MNNDEVKEVEEGEGKKWPLSSLSNFNVPTGSPPPLFFNLAI